jgi:hypothetical protein
MKIKIKDNFGFAVGTLLMENLTIPEFTKDGNTYKVTYDYNYSGYWNEYIKISINLRIINKFWGFVNKYLPVGKMFTEEIGFIEFQPFNNASLLCVSYGKEHEDLVLQSLNKLGNLYDEVRNSANLPESYANFERKGYI